jgi:hypothetical protein
LPILGFSADFLGFQPILGFLYAFKVQVGFRVDFRVFLPTLGFTAVFWCFQPIIGFLTGLKVQVGFRVDFRVYS